MILLLAALLSLAAQAAPSRSESLSTFVAAPMHDHIGYPSRWKAYNLAGDAGLYDRYYWCSPDELRLEKQKSFCDSQGDAPKKWATVKFWLLIDKDPDTGALDWPDHIDRACGRVLGASPWPLTRRLGAQSVSGQPGAMYLADTSKGCDGGPSAVGAGLKSMTLFFTRPVEGKYQGRVEFTAPASVFDSYLPQFQAIIDHLKLTATKNGVDL